MKSYGSKKEYIDMYSFFNYGAEALEVEPYELIRPYDPAKLGLGERLEMIEQLPEIKRMAIEQMLNAFLRERESGV